MEQPKKITKFYKPEIKGVNENDFTVTAVVSTKKVDRDGDIILPDAFKSRLKIYKDHPVLIANHRYTTESIIGEATSIKVTDEGVEATFKYYVGQGSDLADWCFTLAKNGIAAFSVGFIGHEWEPIVDRESKMTVGRTFTDVELIEISQVSVPSNRGALQMGRAAALAEAEVMEAVAKGFADGKFEDQKVVEKKAEEKVSEEKGSDDKGSDHYTAVEDKGVDAKSAEISPEQILDAIRQAFR